MQILCFLIRSGLKTMACFLQKRISNLRSPSPHGGGDTTILHVTVFYNVGAVDPAAPGVGIRLLGPVVVTTTRQGMNSNRARAGAVALARVVAGRRVAPTPTLSDKVFGLVPTLLRHLVLFQLLLLLLPVIVLWRRGRPRYPLLSSR